MVAAAEFATNFFAFCSALPGAERIDDLMLAEDKKNLRRKRADYFFQDRTIICEIKSLETDTNDKIIPILRDAGVPLSAGTFELNALIRNRPDYNDLYRECVNAITTGVQDGLADANRQIRETKEQYQITSADGLVVFLHAHVSILNPDIIMRRIFERLAKKRDDGSTSAHESVTSIVLLSEIHKLQFTDGTTASISVPIRNDAVPEFHDVMEFTARLIDAWADWMGRGNFAMTASEFAHRRNLARRA